MIIDEQGRLDASNYTKYEVDGVNLSVFEAGDRANPTLVMFHGAPHNTQEFRFNIPALLDAGFHIVAADHLGAGDSDRPMEVDLYSGEKDYERAIALMDKMGLDQFYIDCGDRGSLPGWMIATRHPERVLGIISENVTHLNGFFTSGITQKRHSWYMWYFQFDVAKEALAADDWALARAFFDYHPDFQEFILQDWLRPNGLEASWLNWYRSTVHPDKHTHQATGADTEKRPQRARRTVTATSDDPISTSPMARSARPIGKASRRGRSLRPIRLPTRTVPAKPETPINRRSQASSIALTPVTCSRNGRR